jgi:hypothetical protein
VKFDDYSIGDTLQEKNFSAGLVVAMAIHPTRMTHGYLIVRDADNRYTLYGCLRQGFCEPFLPRYVPGEVLRSLAQQAFDMELTMPVALQVDPDAEPRYPVLSADWVPKGMDPEEAPEPSSGLVEVLEQVQPPEVEAKEICWACVDFP